MATREESATTRARANTLREMLTHSVNSSPFDHEEIYHSMDLCLSCKGCKSECPSSVDITKYKAEFLQHYYDKHGVPLRTRAIAWIAHLNHLAILAPGIFNFFVTHRTTSKVLKKILGFAPARSIPLLSRVSLKQWARKTARRDGSGKEQRMVYLFADEFTDYNDTEIGIQAILLLNRLGYRVIIPDHRYSGRTFLSKGLVRKAKKIANKNISLLKDIITEENPLIGIEPSGILTFRDEYPDLAEKDLKEAAIRLAKNCLLIDEFIAKEIESGRITSDLFTKESRHIKLHGHCHQKSLASTLPTKKMLSLPGNYTVEEIKSGCCGMAGSFGYEKEHYDLSMKVGNLVLFPAILNSPEEEILVAPGTSCRHQIKDGTGRIALHPVEALYRALL
jgi:Fe-S oxidoreductase